MPELPEVETVVRQLRGQLVGRTLKGARVSWKRTIALGVSVLKDSKDAIVRLWRGLESVLGKIT